MSHIKPVLIQRNVNRIGIYIVYCMTMGTLPKLKTLKTFPVDAMPDLGEYIGQKKQSIFSIKSDFLLLSYSIVINLFLCKIGIIFLCNDSSKYLGIFLFVLLWSYLSLFQF